MMMGEPVTSGKTTILVNRGQSRERPNDAIINRLVVTETDVAAPVAAGAVDRSSTAGKRTIASCYVFKLRLYTL